MSESSCTSSDESLPGENSHLYDFEQGDKDASSIAEKENKKNTSSSDKRKEKANKHVKPKHQRCVIQNKYECSDCGKTFASNRKYDYTQHLRTHTGEKSICAICGKGFSKPSNLSGHYRRDHLGEKPRYLCDTCGKEFTYKTKLDRHKLIHQKRGDLFWRNQKLKLSYLLPPDIDKTPGPPFHCEICPPESRRKSYISLQYLKRHYLRLHVTEGTIQYPTHTCSVCEKQCKSNSLLTIHMRLHTGERPFTCNQCLLKFKSNTELNIHQQVHAQDSKFQCSICNKYFKQQTSLCRHKKTVHMGWKPHCCEVCGRSFESSSHLNRHMRGVHAENKIRKMKSFACNICGEELHGQLNRQKHIEEHDQNMKVDGKFTCNYCGQQFKKKGKLERHNNRIHNSEGVTIYSCDICERKYRTKGKLDRHYNRIHNNEDVPEYNCNICGQCYKIKGQLLRHRKKVHLINDERGEVYKEHQGSSTSMGVEGNTHCDPNLQESAINLHLEHVDDRKTVEAINMLLQHRTEQQSCQNVMENFMHHESLNGTSQNRLLHSTYNTNLTFLAESQYKADECVSYEQMHHYGKSVHLDGVM